MPKDCHSKLFIDITTAGRYRGMGTINIEHFLFHQSKLEQDVELQNTHIALIRSPRDLMQVSTLSAQLGLRSELVDWYRDATSVPYGHLLLDLSPRTDDYDIVKTPDPIPQSFFIPDRSKHSKRLDCEFAKFLSTPSAPIFFQQLRKSFPSVLP